MTADNSLFPPLPELDSAAGHELVSVSSGPWSLRSRMHRETFHPVIGPAAEAEALHVRQQRLKERARACSEPLVIWDVGLGAAANAVAALRSIESAPACELHSFDLNTDALRFALKHRTQLAYFGALAEACEELSNAPNVEVGRHRWHLHLGDFAELLEDRGIPGPHAILYDPYSPVSNPSMWSLEHFTRLQQRLDPARACMLTSYSRSTAVRVTLLLAGFFVGHGDAIAEKEETTVAANRLDLVTQPLGRGWLERVRRSTRSAPLPHSPTERRISPEQFDRLTQCPQFGERA